MAKTMYVCQPIRASEIGQANWLSSPPALTARLLKAIPFARISKLRTSTGYNACSGVRPTENTAPKRNMHATVAFAAEALVFPEAEKALVATVMPIHTTQQPAMLNRKSGRRPMRSTKAAPINAKTNWNAAYPRLILAWVMPFV